MSHKHVITLFGSSAIRPGDPEYAQAEQLGKALAEAGYTICNGGYMGSMEAAAKGTKEAGGEVMGVIPEMFDTPPPSTITFSTALAFGRIGIRISASST